MSKFSWSPSASERFWPKVNKTGDCWLWTGSIGGHGYGTFNVGKGKYAPAYRFAYIEAHGDIPSNVFIDHMCRNRKCVNPSHLRPVTHKQNTENHGGARTNSKSGVRGVYWQESRRMWQAQVTHNGQTVSRRFSDLSEAESWVKEKRNALHSHNDFDRISDA